MKKSEIQQIIKEENKNVLNEATESLSLSNLLSLKLDINKFNFSPAQKSQLTRDKVIMRKLDKKYPKIYSDVINYRKYDLKKGYSKKEFDSMVSGYTRIRNSVLIENILKEESLNQKQDRERREAVSLKKSLNMKWRHAKDDKKEELKKQLDAVVMPPKPKSEYGYELYIDGSYEGFSMDKKELEDYAKLSTGKKFKIKKTKKN